MLRGPARLVMMGESSAHRDVLLIAADLNERRLLFGELLEAGYDVIPVPGLPRH